MGIQSCSYGFARRHEASTTDQHGGAHSAPKTVSSDLTHIAREVAGDHSISVLLGEAGGGSHANLDKRELTLDPEHVASIGAFVAAHEGAHIRDTATFDQLGVSPLEQAKKLGLLALRNVLEDCAINDRFVRDFPGLHEDTLRAYPLNESEVGFINHPEVQAHAQALGFMPKYAAGLAALLQDWSELRHELGFNRSDSEYKRAPFRGGEIKDKEVEAFIKRVLPDFREAVAMKYRAGASGEEMLAAAKKRHIWAEDVLYPELKKLLEADLERLAKEGPKQPEPDRNDVKADRSQKGKDSPSTGEKDGEKSAGEKSQGERSDNGGGEKSEGNQEQGASQREGADQNGAGEEEKHREGEPQQGGQQGGSAEGAKSQQGGEGEGAGQPGGGQKSGTASGGEHGGEHESPEDGEMLPNSPRAPENSSRNGKPHGTTEASEAEDAARGEFQKLPEAERRRIAEEALAGFDDAVREALKSLFDKQDEAPKAAAVVKRENDKERHAEAEAKAQREYAEGGKGLRDALFRSLSPYQRCYLDVVAKVDEIEGRLKDVFVPNMHFRWERNQPSGPKITMTQAMRFEATGEGHRELFERRIDPTRPDIGVVVLVDRSGSMSGEKIESAVRGAIFTKEIMQRIGVRCAIVGFADEQELLCDFEDGTQEQEIQERIMMGLTLGGGTQDAAALELAANLLKELRTQRGAVVVISDAQSGEGERLKPLVRAVEQVGIPVVHFGIGDGTKDQGGYYTRSFGDLDPKSAGDNNFFDTFAREMENLANELL